jgi:hypothetical protein
VARRATMTFDVVEQGDTIALHFAEERFPPLWFNKRERPTAYSKLYQVLDELEIVEEVLEERAS